MAKLSDSKYVFTLLTAVVKKAGGEIRIPDDVLTSVTVHDVVTLLYDKNTNEVVLRVADSIFTVNPVDDGYEN